MRRLESDAYNHVGTTYLSKIGLGVPQDAIIAV